jgi:acetoacetate decarboxylase
MSMEGRLGTSFDAEAVWSTPADAPTYPRFPIPFRDCSVLSLQYRTDAGAIAAILPRPLEPTGDTVLVQIARWGDVPGLGRDLFECNVMVGAALRTPDRDVSGSYSPYFYLDNDRAVALGREVQGQPKRLAHITLQDRADLHVGVVQANGIDIVTGTLPYKWQRADISQVRARVDVGTNINLKVIPNIDGLAAVRQLVARDIVDLEVSECWSGPCTVELRPNAVAPVHRLPVREHLEGFYWRASFALAGGSVLYTYPAEPSPETPMPSSSTRAG